MDEPHWVKRFTEHGAPGAYLRVVAEGTVGAGDEVEVVDRPDHGVTIGDVFRSGTPTPTGCVGCSSSSTTSRPTWTMPSAAT